MIFVIPRGRAFQAEGRAGAKVLRQKHVWLFQGKSKEARGIRVMKGEKNRKQDQKEPMVRPLR